MRKYKRAVSWALAILLMLGVSGVAALAAEDGALVSIGFVWDGGLNEATEITGSQFVFSGNLDTFDFNKLSNIILLVNGAETNVKVLPDYDPYAGAGLEGGSNHYRKYNAQANTTEFSFYYEKAQLVHPAEYVLTCEYRGQQWRSTTLIWNSNGSIEFDDSTIGVINAEPAPSPVPPSTLIARPTASKVLVNGEEVAFDAYNINDNNYFKLRDLAYVLNGSEKQFEIGWDGDNNAITLTSGEPYTSNGSEMVGKGDGNKTPTATTATIYLDGGEVNFTAYNIDGNNYFKLRDIGLAFDFGVTWDGAKNTIVVDTSIGYTPE